MQCLRKEISFENGPKFSIYIPRLFNMFRRPAIFRKRRDLFIYDNSLLNENRVAAAQKTSRRIGVWEVLSDFYEKSGIHGMAYLGDRKRSLIERVWWAIAIVLSISLCGFWFLESLQLVGYDPIVLRYDKTPSSIDVVPFPAVSICPVTKVAAKNFNYTDVYRALMKFDGENSRNVTPKEFETMKIVNQLCEGYGVSRDGISKLFNDVYADAGIYEAITNLGPYFDETFVHCKLLDKWIDCRKLFSPFISEVGLCYTFNSIALRELLTNEFHLDLSRIVLYQPQSNWNIDFGYDLSDKTNQRPYPHRMIDVGLQYSLTIIMKVNNHDIDHLCGGTVQGFKIGFHSPIDIPREMKKFVQLSPKQAALYVIEPKLIRASNEIRKYTPDERNCLFSDENKLRFFQQYSQSNCEMECLSNYTLAQCGCVHFSMLHAKGTKVCGTAKMSCCIGAEDSFFRSEDFRECHCLSSCATLVYDAHSSTTDFDFASTLSKSNHHEGINLENATFSRLVVSFKDEEFNAFQRVEKHTWYDILSNIGGLCGLFMGASMLSIIELLYYLTLRMFFTYNGNQESDDDNDDRKRVIYVSPAALQNLSNRSHTLDQARPLTFVQRIR